MSFLEVLNPERQSKIAQAILATGKLEELVKKRQEPVFLRRINDFNQPDQVLYQLPPEGQTWESDATYSDEDKVYVFRDAIGNKADVQLMILDRMQSQVALVRIRKIAIQEGILFLNGTTQG